MQFSSSNFSDQITQISSPADFERIALEVFRFQYENNPVYQNYCELLGKTSAKSLTEIPFLPIDFFKAHKIYIGKETPEIIFKSSGTTGTQRSQHQVRDTEIYKIVAQKAFESFFGPLENQIVFALLPNYLEQGESSLVYMVNHFITLSGHPYSGFYLRNTEELLERLQEAKNLGKKVILFGVTYALIDLAEKGIDMRGIHVIETGGMKGRRKEIPKEALHEVLKRGLNVENIYSEYGMTELLSQAYCKNSEPFVTPPWMKIMIRETNDPFTFHHEDSNKSGGISVVDLANVNSCSFIHTQDLGRYEGSGFKLLGRYDHSDIRGCNQLVID